MLHRQAGSPSRHPSSPSRLSHPFGVATFRPPSHPHSSLKAATLPLIGRAPRHCGCRRRRPPSATRPRVLRPCPAQCAAEFRFWCAVMDRSCAFRAAFGPPGGDFGRGGSKGRRQATNFLRCWRASNTKSQRPHPHASTLILACVPDPLLPPPNSLSPAPPLPPLALIPPHDRRSPPLFFCVAPFAFSPLKRRRPPEETTTDQSTPDLLSWDL